MNNQNIRHALSKIAWAYLLILLNFRINDLDLLPNWAGYLLLFSAIALLMFLSILSAEERNAFFIDFRSRLSKLEQSEAV